MLIIGAGLSGLEAARLLRQNKIETIVIEGRDRIGGRVWSVKSKNDYVFDLGASWIHGINGSISGGLFTNPLWDLVQQAKIHTRGTLQTDLRIFYPTNKTNFNVNNLYGEYLTFVRDETKVSAANKTLQYYADLFVNYKNFTEQEQEAFYSYLHFAIESYEGAELNMIGAKGFYDITSIHYGEEHVFHDTGYVTLIDYLAKDAGDIRLKQIVTKISYGAQFAEVQTTNGQIYRANFVLLTVPLGVLKARQIEFSPPLPEWKQNVIDRLGFGILDKAVLVWDNAWWNSTDYYFLRVSSKSTEFGYWVNANKWKDKPALICYFVGKEAYRLETNFSKAQVIEQVRQTLQTMFPDRIVPAPIDSYMTYGKLDPFSNGSYSYVSADQRHEDPSYLAQPLENQLLFAGEATSTDSYGYAHGALMSARREVTRLLYVYNLLQDQPKTNFGRITTNLQTHWLIIIFICLQFLR